MKDRIAAAQKEILVQCYAFTSLPIFDFLVQAHLRGVLVEVLFDWGIRKGRGELDDELNKVGIPVFYDNKHPIAHNKIMIIDRILVATGSFNFTANAEKNGENLIFISDGVLAEVFAANWEAHRMHSIVYAPIQSANVPQ